MSSNERTFPCLKIHDGPSLIQFRAEYNSLLGTGTMQFLIRATDGIYHQEVVAPIPCYCNSDSYGHWTMYGDIDIRKDDKFIVLVAENGDWQVQGAWIIQSVSDKNFVCEAWRNPPDYAWKQTVLRFLDQGRDEETLSGQTLHHIWIGPFKK